MRLGLNFFLSRFGLALLFYFSLYYINTRTPKLLLVHFKEKKINALSYPKTLVFNSINEPNRHCIYQCTAHYCRCNCFCIYELPTEQTWNPTGTPQLHKSSRKAATVTLLFTEDCFMSDLNLLYFMLLVLNVLLS